MTKTRLVIPTLLCLVFLAQGLWFIGTQSLTFDEPVHMITGLDMWKAGRFAQWNDHPPLARALLALPLLGHDWQIEYKKDLGTAWNDHSPKAWLVWAPADPEGLAWHSRPMNLLLGLILAILLWSTAARLYSPGAANVALLLFVFSPCLIAHFSVATTDGIGVLMIFAAAVQFVAWRRNPSRGQSILLGLVLGGLLLAKFYTIPLFALIMALALFLPPRCSWRKAAFIAAVAFVTLWAGYLFHVSWLSLRDGQLAIQSPRSPDYRLADIGAAHSFAIPLPAGEYFAGAFDVFRHNRWGHPSYLLGKISSTGGWKLYYPVLILLKWPTAVLLIAAGVLILVLMRRIHVPGEMRVLLLIPAVFLLFSVFSRIDIGDRHILPVYPFVLLFCAGIWEFQRKRPVVLVALAALLVLQVADAMRYAPDYLSYLNVFVKPQESYRFLSDSNVDWGQGLIALRRYQTTHPGEQIHMAYFGSVFPGQYGIDAVPFREEERPSGTVVISSTHLSGQLLRHPGSYRWLLRYPCTAILDHSLYVFRAP